MKIAKNIQKAYRDLIYTRFRDPVGARQTIKTMTRKIRKIKFSLGFPWGIEDESDLNTYYEGVPDVGVEFIPSWIHAASLKSQRELQYQTDVMFNVSSTNAFYSGRGNQVIIPAAIMQPPFFYGEGQPVYNYAVLGTVSTFFCSSSRNHVDWAARLYCLVFLEVG